MGAMSLVITSACLGLIGNQYNACSKAIEAAGKQTGIEQGIDGIQKRVEKEAENQAHYVLGDSAFGMVGTGAFVVRTVRDKSLQFHTPTFGLCNRITNNLTPNSYSMVFEWKF